MSRITVLGLGAMGSRMAIRLLGAGHAVTVWNRSPQATVPLRTLGALIAETPIQAVESAELVISMVFDDTASRSVWLDEQTGALAGLAPTALAIESSTLTPGWLQELGAAMKVRNIAFVDAPVAGSRPQADAGQLIFMAGGETAAVERVRSILLQLGGALHHVGPLGSGAWLKLVVNALFATQVAAMAEQLALLRAAGVDAERALGALKAMPVLSAAAGGAATLMLARNYTPQAPVDLITKDLTYALNSAEHVGTALPVTEAVAQRFMAAAVAGFGPENLVAVMKLHG
ncbi:MAG: NAD(P)-dependent oxidoreductase [Hydrogenophaga sp.]|uniref:NAD(P)-dependent oxidoreductase n=1 Tax=Hydrogenophaga sp. TaxID=1904254 RepID=UPI002628AC32|nr:NAD(P)-dependent oxidoreductase [Hydrogenophaga sp.]MCV0440918.1 NAD(P)-dependent oxidoreductase [Hydrogenophaga sp.]